MDGLKKAYYRTYQQVFDIGMRCLHWRKPIVISGAGCIRQVPDVLSKSGVTKVMVVTGSHVVKSLGPKLFAALEDAGMPYEVFSEVEANPSVNTVEKIRAQYTETGCSGFVALGGGSPMGDAFWYEGWQGHFNLVKLNLRNPEVVDHLLGAVGMWMDEFGIDGLRLDAADCVDFDFFRRLKAFCRGKRPDFWLMGEIIHGDYRVWANDEMLDSVLSLIHI